MQKTILILLCLFIFTLISCKEEGCTNPAATNYDADAEKDDGTCVLPEPDDRDPYLGNYLAKDTMWLDGILYEIKTYTLQVTTGGKKGDTISLNNLWNGGSNYLAVMNGTNFSIPSQQVSGPYYASGSGNFSSSRITYETSGDAYVNKGSGPKQ